jgi:hypothetical protein
MRHDAALPLPDAATVHEPAIVVTPLALVINVAGSVIVASRPDGSAAAQFTGSVPENILTVPELPTTVWMAEVCASRRAVEYWSATGQVLTVCD